ncbi:Pentatricopeptide repeat-containing protein [Vitis vinifera]|uniref:Pentatricopeptide repeat-containing protein n=1 Tax=Vitis vinifera TaxID=29760 RepID=A0A438JSL7_VITVI|nr:Pentatricopeptide repeat-containing protein [Vitis vinifera]
MGLYGKCGYLDSVLQLFDEMPHRDIASWNTVISSVVKEMMYERAFELFRDMRRIDGFRIDHFTLSTILVAARGLASMVGREIHAHVIKIGFESNISVINALIRFYTKCGSIKHVVALFEKMRVRDVITWTEMITAYMEFGLTDLALEVFDKMPARNSISYNAILSGFCQNGEGSKALAFFCRMVEEGVELTDFTLTGVLNACGLLMEAKISKQIHGFILKFGFGSNACIEAALLDMCTRCGRMADAQKMFSQGSFSQSGSIIWTSMICGYARNAQPEEAISLFCQSQLEEQWLLTKLHQLLVGNSIITMYSKCSNMDDAIKGDEALSVWSKMEKAEHYTSLVGVLGYWGLLEEAEEMINKMPIEPEASVWRALLDACRIHSNTTIGKRAAKHLLAMKPLDPSTYILVSNLYSAYGRWHCSDMVREEMRVKGFRKHPGRSWIFMKQVEEHQKKDFLFYHSAKIAATYGLLMTRPGRPIRIVKNILLCGDCHTFLKYVSIVTGREIFLRDASGHHCFLNGQCSCKDYW